MGQEIDPAIVRQAVGALEKANGNIAAAAAKLGISRSTLQGRLAIAKRTGTTANSPVLDTTKYHADLNQYVTRREAGKVALIKRYVITAAQNATPVHKKFFAALRVYCDNHDAQLVVIPYRYHNPTSMWSANNANHDWWDKSVLPYLLDQRIAIAENLTIMADIKVQPTAERPLSGMDTITGDHSAILGHPKLELVTVPTPHHKLPKILTTTGSCTQKNYTETKAGKKGSFHHTFGASLVEVEGGRFHLRQINALNDGSFMDLDAEYTHKGVSKVDCIEALVMGDTHREFVDPDVMSATFGAGGVVPTLRPKLVVWHDLHDFYARNHHHKNAVFINFAKHHAGAHNVRKDLEDTFAFVDQCTAKHGGKNVFVPSNHPDALNRWVQETDPRDDPENAVFWAQTFVACCEGAKMENSGVVTIDPFAYWAGRMLKCIERTIMLRRDESMVVNGVELGYHGDRGPNGSRGSIGGFTKIGVKSIIGHSHTPGIRNGVYQVGLNGRLKLEYASGPSSWLQTDCILYKNGKRTLINFIGGKWRA